VTRQDLCAYIEYARVALDLSAAEVAGAIKEVTGADVDPEAANYLQVLNQPELEATWRRLSEDARWKDSGAEGKAKSAGTS